MKKYPFLDVDDLYWSHIGEFYLPPKIYVQNMRSNKDILYLN